MREKDRGNEGERQREWGRKMEWGRKGKRQKAYLVTYCLLLGCDLCEFYFLCSLCCWPACQVRAVWFRSLCLWPLLDAQCHQSATKALYWLHTCQPIPFTSIKYSCCFSIILGGYSRTGKWIQENIIFMRFCCCFKLNKKIEKLSNEQLMKVITKCTLAGLVQYAKKSHQKWDLKLCMHI